MIYHIRGEHTNYYTSDAVELRFDNASSLR